MKTNRLTEIKNKEHELKSQHQLENAFDKKRGSVEFKPQKINSKNIYGNKSCILQRWFKKISCSEVEVTDSEKDQRGFYIKGLILPI